MKLIMENWKRYLSEMADLDRAMIKFHGGSIMGGEYPDQVALKFTQRIIRNLKKYKYNRVKPQLAHRSWYKERFDLTTAGGMDSLNPKEIYSHFPAVFVKAYEENPKYSQIQRSVSTIRGHLDTPPPRDVIDKIRRNCEKIIEILNSIPD